MLQTPGPVITISREHGCDAKELSKGIKDRLRTLGVPQADKWKKINKEILQDASKELKISTLELTHALTDHHETLIEDLLHSFSNHYDVSSRQIIDTIREVILLYAHQGKTIIIGRGGVFMTAHIQNSLHIKLQAPFDWRVKQIQNKFNIDLNKATEQCRHIDEKRKAWNDQLDKSNVGDSAYDLILNSKTLSTKQQVDIVITALKCRKIIPHNV